MNTQTFLYYESIRQSIYKGFSECFYLPEDTLNQTLKTLRKSLGILESAASNHLRLMQSELENVADIVKLKVDFSRLFIGPNSLLAPPYGSVYLEAKRKIMGDSTINAIQRYREAGLVMDDHFHDVPDHISVELEFMYYLIFKEIEAIQAEKIDEANKYIDRQSAFLQDHIGAWFFQFVQLIESHAETDFYRNLAAAFHTFISEEISDIYSLNTAQEQQYETVCPIVN